MPSSFGTRASKSCQMRASFVQEKLRQTTGRSSYAPQPPVPMTKAAFAELLKELQRRSFSDEKLNLARDAVTGGAYFTCEQVGQMMRTASFGDDQVKIAATLYPRIVDPQNFIQLTSILTFESDRQKLRQLVGR